MRLARRGTGYVAGLEAERVGRAAVALGAGRAKLDDVVDPAVGIEVLAPVGCASPEALRCSSCTIAASVASAKPFRC